MERQHPPIIGLVGGIGSGKSALARWLADHLDGQLIDADVAGHRVLLRDDVKSEVRREFGEAVFSDGEIDRKLLAAAVFGDDPGRAAARSRLESIVHPGIEQAIDQQIADAKQRGDARVIVLDAAVLLEAGWSKLCDVVAFVDVPDDERRRRVAEARGWSADELSRREASQWPLARKQAACDVVIDNSHNVEQAGRQLAKYLDEQGRLDRPPPGPSGESAATSAVLKTT